jgi:PPK2 family polyphosphate:nucleotide phosphotransferase
MLQRTIALDSVQGVSEAMGFSFPAGANRAISAGGVRQTEQRLPESAPARELPSMKLDKLAHRYRVDAPEKFQIAACDPADCCGLTVDKAEAKTMLADSIARLSDLQERLYAQDRWAVLVVLQAMDAAGKDGVIKHVMTGINPQGCQVTPFKAPSAEELDHDFLWRVAQRLPERGRIGIFNRSHYEEVLVVRVHPELLVRQRLPDKLVGDALWKHRFKDIRAFERHLARNGTLILKFFLNVSKEEQRRRFLERLEEPSKRWKFSMGDVGERRHWDEYMTAYEDMIRNTSRPEAPWYVVPADNKWFTRLVVAAAIVDAMDRLDLAFPKVTGPALTEMEKVRHALQAEAPGARQRRSRRK